MEEPIKFWTIAKDETHNWDAEVLARNGIRAAFGLYLIREGEATYCCEITPSSAAEFLGNRFVMEDADSEWDDPEGLESNDGGCGGVSYLQPMIRPETHDSRFIAGPIEVTAEDMEDRGEYWEGDPDRAAWEAARESWNANPDEPGILWDATFDAWQAELSAKRRAENVPPLSGRGAGMLPLFYAAALKMLPNGEPTRESEAAMRRLGWL